MGDEHVRNRDLPRQRQWLVSSTAELQDRLLDAIAVAKDADPLAPVTLVVPSRSLAWQVRRQLARRLAPGTALAAVDACTPMELLDACALAVGLDPATGGDRLARLAVLEGALRTAGELGVSADHPETAMRIGRVLDDLRWCRLDDAQFERLAEVATATMTTTIGFVREVRGRIARATGAVDLPQLADRIREALDPHGPTPPALTALGTIIIATPDIPAPVRHVIEGLGLPVTWVQLQVGPGAVPAQVLAMPDPATEAAVAVRAAAEAIDGGRPSEQIAIMYSADIPYAGLLEHALRDSGIAWHGPTASSLRQTALARQLDTLLELAGELSHGGPQRTTLMRWLALRPARATSDEPTSAELRDLIRVAGLYGDVRNWSEALQLLAQHTSDERDEDEDPSARGRARLRSRARHLDALLAELLQHLQAIAHARTWTELAHTVSAAMLRYQPAGSPSASAQAAAQSLLSDLLQASLPQIDTLVESQSTSRLRPAPDTLRSLIDREFDQARASHGNPAIGIHVGPVASTRCLTFEQVIVIGAADGLLPSVRHPNALISDTARTLLRTDPSDAPTVLEREAGTRRDIIAVTTGATSVLVTYPRGALPTGGVARPSRYFRSAGAGERSGYLSYRDALRTGPPPVTDRDLAACRPAEGADSLVRLRRTTNSLHAWARPTFDAYFGNIGDSSSRWEVASRPLSASAVETYLHCPYGFFVDRILGFSTDAFDDAIEEISTKDLGLLLHACLEELVRVAAERGWLPGPGQPWPAPALQQAIDTFDTRAQAAQAKGLTGWAPAWRATYQQILLAIPQFLELDLQLRASPPMAPGQPEVAFGFPGQSEVVVITGSGAAVRLRGAIDRLDTTEDGSAARVIDYKTGNAKTFKRNLDNGAKVQHLVYAVAVQTLRPSAGTPLVTYVFIPNQGQVDRIDANVGEDPGSALVRVLDALVESSVRGSYPPRTTPGRDYCPVCSRLGRRAARVSEQAGAHLLEDPEVQDA